MIQANHDNQPVLTGSHRFAPVRTGSKAGLTNLLVVALSVSAV